MAINKVVYGSQSLIDLTNDTLEDASQLMIGVKAHTKSGVQITGTASGGTDTSDATAADSDIRAGTSAYIATGKVDGTFASQEKTATPTTSSQNITPDEGKWLSKVTVNAIQTQTATITPSAAGQTVEPDTGKYLTQVDINGDPDLTAGNVRSGVNIFGVTGSYVAPNGYVDTSDATATAAQILAGSPAITAYVNGQKITGTMPNSTGNIRISSRDANITIPAGYHAGTSNVRLDSTARGLLVPENIRDGVTILGQPGSYVAPSGWADLSTMKLYCTRYNQGNFTDRGGQLIKDYAITIGFKPKLFIIRANVAVRTNTATSAEKNRYYLVESYSIVPDSGDPNITDSEKPKHDSRYGHYNSSYRLDVSGSKNIYFEPTSTGVVGHNTTSVNVYFNQYSTTEYVWFAWG